MLAHMLGNPYGSLTIERKDGVLTIQLPEKAPDAVVPVVRLLTKAPAGKDVLLR